MRTLPLPAPPTGAVLATCIAGVTDPDLALRLGAVGPALGNSANAYVQHAQARTLHLVPRVANLGAVSGDELRGLYSDHMSATRGSARTFYDAIRNASPNQRCPLCGIGTVTVLDHHLPKSSYPDLSVCPANLVPACDFCNNAKRAKYPLTAGEQTLHPYFDDYTAQQWIYARLDTTGSPVLVFFVLPPPHWAQVDKDRVQRHFTVVKLGHAYTSNANDDLIPLRGHLANIAAQKGTVQVQAYLNDEMARYAGRPNSWQHVMYQTLSRDAGFVDGGYLNIPT